MEKERKRESRRLPSCHFWSKNFCISPAVPIGAFPPQWNYSTIDNVHLLHGSLFLEIIEIEWDGNEMNGVRAFGYVLQQLKSLATAASLCIMKSAYNPSKIFNRLEPATALAHTHTHKKEGRSRCCSARAPHAHKGALKQKKGGQATYAWFVVSLDAYCFVFFVFALVRLCDESANWAQMDREKEKGQLGRPTNESTANSSDKWESGSLSLSRRVCSRVVHLTLSYIALRCWRGTVVSLVESNQIETSRHV